MSALLDELLAVHGKNRYISNGVRIDYLLRRLAEKAGRKPWRWTQLPGVLTTSHRGEVAFATEWGPCVYRWLTSERRDDAPGAKR